MGLQYLIWIGFNRIHACTKVHVYVHVWLRLGNQLLFVSDRFRSLDAPDFVSTLDRNPTDPNRPLLRSHYSLRYSVESRLSSTFTTLCSILFRHNGMNGFLVCGPAAGLGCFFCSAGSGLLWITKDWVAGGEPLQVWRLNYFEKHLCVFYVVRVKIHPRRAKGSQRNIT